MRIHHLYEIAEVHVQFLKLTFPLWLKGCTRSIALRAKDVYNQYWRNQVNILLTYKRQQHIQSVPYLGMITL